MPQMAPMMWQTIYISCIVLLMTSMTKNFFTKNNISTFMGKAGDLGQEKTWKW